MPEIAGGIVNIQAPALVTFLRCVVLADNAIIKVFTDMIHTGQFAITEDLPMTNPEVELAEGLRCASG
ncbi:hypothetical protein GCM10011357_17040 [Lacimicrobium alkaliphilum]|uniref:Uncharacterized protein n=1 Tax=Lacimicrobium alkaliphilum TaxID=1526571 RepID=A0ABQ1R8Q7_9ALTE|nr:hypothetical protein GCM10011357_17040 [Lacimicrobium alkaliphilum]